MTLQTCAECGFDSRAWKPRDARAWIEFSPSWWEQALVGVPAGSVDDALPHGPLLLLDGDALVDAAHLVSHRQMAVARQLADLGAGAPHHTGSVVQLNVSGGGVPKLAVDHAVVGFGGVEGDVQKTRKHHGRAFQALCLWSQEVITALAAEGHPVAPGSAGENVTMAGVDWSTLRPGTLLRIGSVLAELSADATPCKQQARWFSDGDFNRISIERAPGRVRWYAWVREPGEIAVGDPVVVRPPI